MLIIYGLGNNESKYLNTKHNVGRIVVQNIANQIGVTFTQKQDCWMAEMDLETQKVWLVYSNGYMNNSGAPLSKLITYYKLDQKSEPLQLLIIQDDSDQLESAVKLVSGGRSSGHRGIDSINQHISKLNIEPKNIWKLKIGIRPIENKLKSETFVLSGIGESEKNRLTEISNQLMQNLGFILNGSWDKVQNVLNAKKNVGEYGVDS